jgi:hypothetical protein
MQLGKILSSHIKFIRLKTSVLSIILQNSEKNQKKYVSLHKCSQMMNIAYKYIKDKNLDDVHLFHCGEKLRYFFDD